MGEMGVNIYIILCKKNDEITTHHRIILFFLCFLFVWVGCWVSLCVLGAFAQDECGYFFDGWFRSIG